MNRQLAEQVANAILYEGYMLYPYRSSAVKNQQLWTFGTLYPPEYSEVRAGTEFAHAFRVFAPDRRRPASAADNQYQTPIPTARLGEQSKERSSEFDLETGAASKSFPFHFDNIEAAVSIASEPLPDNILKPIELANTTSLPADAGRDSASLALCSLRTCSCRRKTLDSSRCSIHLLT